MQDKNRKLYQTSILLIGLGLAFIAGCAHNKSAPIAQNAPDWVNKGNGAFKNGGKSTFYGVGMISGIRNEPLAVMGADDRARGELAKIMNDYVAVLTKDYMQSITTGNMDKSSEEQLVSSTMKNFAQFTLHGAVIIDHWKDPSTGILYSLCQLDMDAVQQSLAQSKDLDAKTAAYVKADADKAFDELNTEETKH